MSYGKLSFRYVDNARSFGGHRTKVTRIDGPSGLVAVAYQAILNEDFDGAPTAYGPAGKSPKPLDKLGNARNDADAPFSAAGNTWQWVGLYSAKKGESLPAGYTLDEQASLRDELGRYPVIQPSGYYISTCPPVTGPGWDQKSHVNASEIRYTVLSGTLRKQNANFGDFGVAIRNDTGAWATFVIADSAGVKSAKVGECSTKLFRYFFPRADQEGHPVSFLVFPNSGPHKRASNADGENGLRHLSAWMSESENVDCVPLLFGLNADPQRLQRFLKVKQFQARRSHIASRFQRVMRQIGFCFRKTVKLKATTKGRRP